MYRDITFHVLLFNEIYFPYLRFSPLKSCLCECIVTSMPDEGSRFKSSMVLQDCKTVLHQFVQRVFAN